MIGQSGRGQGAGPRGTSVEVMLNAGMAWLFVLLLATTSAAIELRTAD